jgi:hypothetical protein
MAHSSPSARLSALWSLLGSVKRSGLFDVAWYRQQSNSAKWSPFPLLHYMLWGWRSGLDPSNRFDTDFYIHRYRDVQQSTANPLMHFLLHGQEEGRLRTQTGGIVRSYLHPEFHPLPIFGVPGESGSRLTLVIDDNTPRILGLGYRPLVGLALHFADQSAKALRIIIRSTSITTAEVSEAIQGTMPSGRPELSISRRTPGATDDVEALEDEQWWASSASAYRSLADLVPPAQLTWVISADEATRSGNAEYRLQVEALLGNKDIRSLVLGAQLAKHLRPAGTSATIDALPPLFDSPRAVRGAREVVAVVDLTSPESLVARSIELLEFGLTRGVIQPASGQVGVVGLNSSPLTLSGSIEVLQYDSGQEGLESALAAAQQVIIVGAGTEEPWLGRTLSSLGYAVVALELGDSRSIDALAKALESPNKPVASSVNWSKTIESVTEKPRRKRQQRS